jgi:integrase
MAIIKRGKYWFYQFGFNGTMHRKCTYTTNKKEAEQIEEHRKRELRAALTGFDMNKQRGVTIEELGTAYLDEYRVRRPKSIKYREYGLGHVTRHLGKRTSIEITPETVIDYQRKRSEEGAAPKTINDEVVLLLRVIEERGDQLRLVLKRKGQLTLPVDNKIGKAFTIGEQDRMLEAAEKNTRSPHINFALRLSLNAGMRDAEIKNLTWAQINFAKKRLTVGASKTEAGAGRPVPLNAEVFAAFEKHAAWYSEQFKELKPEWYVFPFGRPGHLDPTKPVTSFKTAWTTVRAQAGVTGRWHDTRHTVVTQLGESGASPATIMATVGHVSRRMLERYSHANLDAQHKAMEQMDAYRNEQRRIEQQAMAQLAIVTKKKKSTRAA